MPRAKLQPLDKVCENCKEAFRAVSAYQIRFQRFCGLKCSRTQNGNGRLRVYVDKTCPTCGKVFAVKPSHVETRTTGSQACRGAYYRSGVRSGENSPAWKGGDVKAQARAEGGVCEHPDCRGKGTDATVHAHHMWPLSVGGLDGTTNLILLCEDHHQTMEAALYDVVMSAFPDLTAMVCRDVAVEAFGDR